MFFLFWAFIERIWPFYCIVWGQRYEAFCKTTKTVVSYAMLYLKIAEYHGWKFEINFRKLSRVRRIEPHKVRGLDFSGFMGLVH